MLEFAKYLKKSYKAHSYLVEYMWGDIVELATIWTYQKTVNGFKKQLESEGIAWVSIKKLS